MCLAWDRAHERINADSSWVLKQLDPLALGHYNLRHVACSSCSCQAAATAPTKVAGLPLEVDDDNTSLPALIPEDEVARAGYSDNLSAESLMGPA